MTESSLFLSSCSRRQLARRRPGHRFLAGRALSLVFGLAVLVLALWPLAAGPAGAASGNRLRITIPVPARRGATYDVVITGSAATPATAYLFLDYAGCAASAGAERRRSGAPAESYGVSGVFSEVGGWRSSSPAVDHACGYLVDRGGHQLASARRAYRVG